MDYYYSFLTILLAVIAYGAMCFYQGRLYERRRRDSAKGGTLFSD